MIIAIDEVGDFASTSQRYNFMVGVLITRHSNGVATKQAQFERWKVSINKSKFTNQNEVKGSDLNEEELFRFTNEVILTDPIVRNIQIRLKPFETSQKLFEKFKEIETNLIQLVIEHSKSINDVEGEKFYSKLSRWLRDRNFQHYLKMVLLEDCIGRCVEMAIGVSIINWDLGDDTDLMNLEIKIDRDYINKSGEKKYFKELLRQAFRRITETHPIPMIRELLDSEHPFVDTYMLPNGMINLGGVFNERCDFLDSHKNFELQIADILGTIFHRAHNRNTSLDSYTLLERVLGNRGQIKTHLVLNQDPDTHVGIRFEDSEE